jgi:hypothetical protein
MHPSILMALCPACELGNDCPGEKLLPAAAGGVTCGNYVPAPTKKMSPAHILALPDREPCADCAATKGSVPNGTHHSLANFEMCVREGEPFLCHADGKGRICGGWLRAAKKRAEKEGAGGVSDKHP